MKKILALKIDVDTERGTRVGVPQLLQLFAELHIPATFLFSLGPDNTGRAIRRVFRKGFLQKINRTSVVSVYGLRTLLNGVLLPGPHIGKRHGHWLAKMAIGPHEVGIHSYDHTYWQDRVTSLSPEAVMMEFSKAAEAFTSVFNTKAQGAGAPGWQANAASLAAYDAQNLLYGSDCRGNYPFIPKVGHQIFKTPQIPTTLPTLDEIIGDPAYPKATWTNWYLEQIKSDKPNVLTLHAELEGMAYLSWFREFLQAAQKAQITLMRLDHLFLYWQANHSLPVCEFIQGQVPGRSGQLAMQGNEVSVAP